MTLSGSRAMVNRNRAMAGPNAMKVQPKKTDAVILGIHAGNSVRQRDKGRFVVFVTNENSLKLLFFNQQSWPAFDDGATSSTSVPPGVSHVVTWPRGKKKKNFIETGSSLVNSLFVSFVVVVSLYSFIHSFSPTYGYFCDLLSLFFSHTTHINTIDPFPFNDWYRSPLRTQISQ